MNFVSKKECFIDNSLFLEHFGRKGMHWGVRNGPPYPLDQKIVKKLKKGKNEKVRVSDKEYEQNRTKVPTRQQSSGVSRYYNPTERKLIETVSADGLRGHNVATILNDNAYDNLPAYMKKQKTSTVTTTDARLCNYDRTIAGQRDKGLNNNCVKCSSTLELRKRGYDVFAGRSVSGMWCGASQYYWDGAVPYKETYDNIESRISKFGNKGSGEFVGRRADGSGHSVYFQNVRGSDGKYHTQFVDGQVGKVYDSLSSLYEAEGFDKSQMGRITRFDNATPNFKHMAQDSVVRSVLTDERQNQISVKRNENQMNYGSPDAGTYLPWDQAVELVRDNKI